MPPVPVVDLKRALVAAGFEVYRTRGAEVQLADRVRDNLIMDSRVSVVAAEPLVVRLTVRAQRGDFPGDTSGMLFDRARALAAGAVARGFAETVAVATPIIDPGDAEHTLDTWYEVTFEATAADVAAALIEARFAFGVEKAAAPAFG